MPAISFSALFASDTLVPVGQRSTAGKVGRPGELYRFEGPVAGTRTRELRWDSVRSPKASTRGHLPAFEEVPSA